MSLRHDSLFALSLSPPTAPSSSSPSSPPPLLQLRLTEHALSQLAAALCPDGKHLDPAKLPPDLLRIDLGPPTSSHAAALHIGSSRLPIQRSTETALHEVYRLNNDETCLSRIGTVSQKLSVRPSHITAGAASRLKERQEEQDLRKERKRAVVIDQPINAPKLSSKQQRRVSLGIKPSGAFVGGASLSRTSSLRKVNLIRQESRHERHTSSSPFRAGGNAREAAAIAGPSVAGRSSTASLHSSPEARSASIVGADGQRGRLDHSQVVGAARLTDVESLNESGQSDTDSVSSPPKNRYVALDRQAGSSRASSTASAATAGTASTTTNARKPRIKLTTRERLAKAAKGRTKLLVDPEKKANPAAARAAAKASASKPITAAASSGGGSSSSNSARTTASAADSSRTCEARPASVSKTRADTVAAAATASSASQHARTAAPQKSAQAPVKEPAKSSTRAQPATSQHNILPPRPVAGGSKAAGQPKTAADRASRSPTRHKVDQPSPRKRARPEEPAGDAACEVRDRAPPTSAAAASTAAAREARQAASVPPAPPASAAMPVDRPAPSPPKKQRRLSPPGPPPPLPPAVSRSTAPLLRSPSPSSPLLPTVKGVGPGAAHWLEPWLDVRSRADWHRLAARFSKTSDEYAVTKRRLDEERGRVEVEWQLAMREEGGGGLEIVTSDEGEETPRDVPAPPPPPSVERRRRESEEEEGMVLEEGEMSSSLADALVPGGGGGDRSVESQPQSILGLCTTESTSRRSTSPKDNLVWRTEDTNGSGSGSRSNTTSPSLSRAGSTMGGYEGKTGGTTVGLTQPLPYRELEALAERYRELHGCLTRMQSVLVENKEKFSG